MDIKSAKDRPARAASKDHFTGAVQITPVIEAEAPARLRAASVHFPAGARTAWHTHPLGQTLLVTEGRGLAQSWGGQVRSLEVGDVVWFAPGEKHWHGAAPDSEMTHVAMQEALDGKVADWMELVTDAEYGAS